VKGQATRVDLTPTTFEDLFRVEYPPLVLALQVLTGDRQRAEDLARDSLARAAPLWSSASSDAPVTTVRRAAVEASAPSRWRRALGPTALDRTALRGPGSRDEVLWQAVRDLPAKQRWAVALHHVGGVPVVEVAAVLGCSTRAAGAQLTRAMSTLAAHTGDVWLEGEPSSNLDEHVHEQLVTASARLAATRPDRAATRTALKHLAPPRREPRTWRTFVKLPEVIGLVVGLIAAGALVNARANSDEPLTITVGPELRPLGVDAETTNIDFDGDGGRCITVNLPGSREAPAVGCIVGTELRSGRALMARLDSRSVAIGIDPADGTVDLRSIGPRNGPSCIGPLARGGAPNRSALVTVVACNRAVPTLYGVLPTDPDGATRWLLVGDDRRVHQMTARRAADPYWLFETAQLDGGVRCLVVASGVGSGAWAEQCDAGTDGISLARFGSAVLAVNPLSSEVSVLDDARLDVGGCGTELSAVLAAMPADAMVTRLACRDGFAVARRAMTRLGTTSDGMVYALTRRADATWMVAAQGSTYSCPTLVFCTAFERSNVLTDVLRSTPID